MKSTDQYEILLGHNVPAEMEQYHNIQPTKVKPTTRNPYMFNPLKVCKFNQFMCVCTVYCTAKCSLQYTGNGKGGFKTFYVLSEIRLELLFCQKNCLSTDVHYCLFKNRMTAVLLTLNRFFCLEEWYYTVMVLYISVYSVFSFTSQLRHEILLSAMLEVQNNVV